MLATGKATRRVADFACFSVVATLPANGTVLSVSRGILIERMSLGEKDESQTFSLEKYLTKEGNQINN